MGAQPDEESDSRSGSGAQPSQEIAWINRDAAHHHAVSRLETRVEANLEAKGAAHPPAPVRGGPLAPETPFPMPPGWVLGAGGLALLVCATVIGLRLHASAANLAHAAHNSMALVSVLTPGVTPVTTTVTFTGAIYARYDMPIGVDTDAGRIVAIYAEAGDHVTKGQLLARLTDTVLQPEIDRLAAVLEQARAQAAMSAGEYRRAQSVLASAGALSQEEVEKRRAAALTDAASVKVAEAQLEQARARLERTRVVSPVDGVVLTRKAEIGQIASPGGDALFRIASGGELEMRGQVPEQDLPALKVGQSAQVKLPGVTQTFPGKVRLLSAVIDPQTRLGEIRIALQSDPVLRPGAFARGSVEVGEAARPVLPQTAVLTDGQGAYVYVVDEHNQVQRRAVHVGGSLDAGLIIDQGLTGTERVVSTAAGFLREGETVNVAPQNTAKAPS